MRIATVATGGIGGFLAVKLARAGHEIITIARGAHLQAIRESGLTLTGPAGTENVHPVLATDNPHEAGPVDAIIFAVKAAALPAAAEMCRPMLSPDTVVVPFLNGVEAAERLMEVLPADNVANGVARVSTTISAPGVISQVGKFQTFLIAERDSRPSARIDALRAAIAGAGAAAPEVEDIDRDLWEKFVLFAALSGVTAAGRCTIGDIRAHDALADLFRGVTEETARIGRALGVALDSGLEDRIWADQMVNFPGHGRASTAIDIEHGRPLEVDWVSGAAVRLAAKAGVAAPLNAALYALLMPHRDGR